MQLTEQQKSQIAKIATPKANAIENGFLKIWMTTDGHFKITDDYMDFRDEDHFFITIIHIQNEEHPYEYEEDDIINILDHQEKMYQINVPTYDVVFNDFTSSNSKGFQESLEYCRDYVEASNGTNDSYFADYKGGTVAVVCNDNGQRVFEEKVK